MGRGTSAFVQANPRVYQTAHLDGADGVNDAKNSIPGVNGTRARVRSDIGPRNSREKRNVDSSTPQSSLLQRT